MRRTVVSGFIIALASSTSLVRAASVLIDFENETPGTYASLSETDPNLSGPIVFKTLDGSDITVTDLSSVSGAVTFGSASIEAASPILMEFPSAVSSVSLQAGHNDGTSYTLQLQGFTSSDGSGSAAGTDTEPLPAVGTFFNSTTLEVDQPGLLSAEFSGGGSSVYLDNVSVTTGGTGGTGPSAVPLPSSAAMFPLGAACVGFVLYRNRRKMLATSQMR